MDLNLLGKVRILMAQWGTDVVANLAVGQTFIAPTNLTLLGGAASLGTAGSTGSTLTVNKNGSATALAPTVAASATAGAVSTLSPTVSLVAGDSLTITAAYGTSAANGVVTLWAQRAA